MAKIKKLTGKFSDFSGIVLKAAAAGNVLAVRKYLKINPDWLNQKGPHGRTLLWEAAYKGRTELVTELIKLGAKVHVFGSYYTPMYVELTPLAVAELADRDELVRVLKRGGAKDDFYAACHRGDLAAMKKFLKRKPKLINTPSCKPPADEPPRPRMGWHPIHYAVVGGSLDAVKLLVEKGADVAEHLKLLVDWAEDNRTIIRYVKQQAKSQNAKLAKAALAPDPNFADVPEIDRPNWLGFPPIVDESRGNHNATDDPKRVKELIDAGADVNVTDSKGKTALHRAAKANFCDIAKLLLKNRAKINATDTEGWTPLFDAAFNGRPEVLKLLIKKKAKINHLDRRGETALFAAGRAGCLGCFKLLVNAGANQDRKNKKGKTVLDILSRLKSKNERKEIVRLLS